MDTTLFPTKGNLIKAKNTLAISKMGYYLMDKKRNVLIREILELNNRSAQIQEQIESVFDAAYKSLQLANIEMGLRNVEIISYGVPVEENVRVKPRSIMGVDIPVLSMEKTQLTPNYGFNNTSFSLDDAYMQFKKVKELIVNLATVETAAYRLAVAIKKTQKRANALKNITIPKYEALTKSIQETLEERDRDEFVRLKMIKEKK